MRIIYEGVDITEKVQLTEAVTTDCAGGAADCIELTLQGASDWLRWGPKQGDRVEIADEGYRSGAMYIDTLKPDGDVYKLVAYSMPLAARARRWASYERATLAELAQMVAGELGMSAALYGVAAGVQYPYLVRRNETGPAFLQRVLGFEGAVLKCYDGKLLAIDLTWAQALGPVRTLALGADLAGAKHNKTDGSGYARCTVMAPCGTGTARDTNSTGTGELPITDEPVHDTVQAARWARGRLMTERRGSERLDWAMDFNPSLTGLARIDVVAPGDLGGAWIVERVKHDHVQRKSDCVFYRCLSGIV